MFSKSRFISFLVPVLLAGTCVILFFIVLNGASTSSGLAHLYWLQANTSSIKNAPYSTSRWTYYELCGVENGSNHDCGNSTAGYPISPADNFGRSNVPSDFNNHQNLYYHLSKVAYAFHILALLFSLLAFFSSFGIICKPSGILTKFFGASLLLATVFSIIASVCITVVTVRVRNAFQSSGLSASVGANLMALTWTSLFILMLTVALCIISLCYMRHERKVNQSKNDYKTKKQKQNSGKSGSDLDRMQPISGYKRLMTMRNQLAPKRKTQERATQKIPQAKEPVVKPDNTDVLVEETEKVNKPSRYSNSISSSQDWRISHQEPVFKKSVEKENAPSLAHLDHKKDSIAVPSPQDIQDLGDYTDQGIFARPSGAEDVILTESQYPSVIIARRSLKRPKIISIKEEASSKAAQKKVEKSKKDDENDRRVLGEK
ncbi:Fmp45 protein [Saccharomycopsis crataegensis]|uniref:Fmp45 protein n=1 Tax=Saccharomycopsis crataegensis TaxID=43959 RepID=A0AAV5QW13_9ASCO|nr:Fmp45 protein [Saccharomycopsis crataegensis]